MDGPTWQYCNSIRFMLCGLCNRAGLTWAWPPEVRSPGPEKLVWDSNPPIPNLLSSSAHLAAGHTPGDRRPTRSTLLPTSNPARAQHGNTSPPCRETSASGASSRTLTTAPTTRTLAGTPPSNPLLSLLLC